MRRNLARGLALALGLALTLGVVELLLRQRPLLLPRWYRESFPFHGVELFHPGILARTPVEGIPLPLPVATYSGAPPADLIENGIAPPDEREDAQRFPDLLIPADEDGFPNPRRLERADLVLLGDSFGVGAGVERPAGLRARLAAETGLSVYNISVAGIGPIHEEWLLREVAFAKEPRAVIWLFYSGNDATYSIEPLVYRRLGSATYAQAHADRLRPPSLLFDLLRATLRADEPQREPLPGFPLRRADGALRPIWLLPENLAQLGHGREVWEASIGWNAARDAMQRAIEACRERGVTLVFVYLPTKSEVYLPFVEADPALLVRTLARHADPSPEDPLALHERLLANRGALEATFRAFCDQAGVACLSATPYLEALARQGELAYLATDTHWQVSGQDAILGPLLELLRRQRVLDREQDG